MPTHLEDSDGHNGDDDSIDSLMQRRDHQFGYRENDDVPTRDVGPERLPNLFSQARLDMHRSVFKSLFSRRIFTKLLLIVYFIHILLT
jgi:hypothetical protein